MVKRSQKITYDLAFKVKCIKYTKRYENRVAGYNVLLVKQTWLFSRMA